MGVNTRAHIDLRVFRQKLSSLIISRSICVKGRNELRMKAAAVIHMLSLRNFKTESYTRSPNVEGLVAVSRHFAVVHGGVAHIHIHIHILCGVMLRVPFECLKLLECKYDTKSRFSKTQAPQQPALSLSLHIYIYTCIHGRDR